MATPTSQRQQNYNTAVRETLIDWILQERLRPGDRFNETQIAELLGVSQTPVREALFRLAGEGIVSARRGKGFALRYLDDQGFRDLHGVVSGLEALALRSCPKPTATKVRELRAINARFARSKSRRGTVELDHDWHLTLVRDCTNGLILEKLEATKVLTFSYALAYWNLAGTLERSVQQHARIIEALASGATAKAARLVERNWLDTTEVLLAGLEERAHARLLVAT